VAACERDGIAFLPWSPFGGIGNAVGVGSAAVQGVARARGVSPHRVVLAWLLARSPVMIPIPGVSRPETALDCARAPALRLEPGELAALAAESPPPGPDRGQVRATARHASSTSSAASSAWRMQSSMSM
jgi:aryl-alcohol dehydrogenase-like predicted oxidoreductase